MAKKKKSNLKRNIIVIILCIVCMALGYFGTLLIDKAKKGGTVDVTVTFDDNESYVIPNTSKLTKEEALKEWPYIINLENKGDAKGIYQIRIKELDNNNIKRDDLEYVLLLNDKEVVSNKLTNIKDDVLYTYEINGSEKQNYKLYIWVNNELDDKEDEKLHYEYSLEFKTIKAFGPGF